MPPISPNSPHVYCWDSPTGINSPMWKHDLIRPISRTFVTSPYSFSPPGYPTGGLTPITQYPLPTGQLGEYARAAADVVFQHMHKQGAVSGKGRYDNGAYDCGFFIQNWGSYTGITGYDVCVLVGHPADRITNFTYPVRTVSGLTPTTIGTRLSFGGITGTVNDYSYFMASGIAECKLYTEFFADSLKQRLDASGMCYPKYCFWDFEDFLDSRIVHAYNAGQVGQYRNAQLDPRYSTQTIYYDRIGATGLSPVTYSGWFTSITGILNTNADILHISNSGACLACVTASNRVLDYALTKSLYEPLKERFPNIQCGNYGIIQTNRNNPVTIYASQYWLNLHNPFLLGDYSTHEIYPVDYTDASYYANYINPGEGTEDFSLRVVSGILNSMVLGAVTGNKKVIPWVGMPGVGDSIGTSGVHLDNYNECAKNNIDTIILFNPTKAESSVSIIENFMAYRKYQVSGYHALY